MKILINSNPDIWHFPFEPTFELPDGTGAGRSQVLQQIKNQINRDGFSVVQISPAIFTSRVDGKLSNAPNMTMINQLQLLLEFLQSSDISPVLLSNVPSRGSNWEPGQTGNKKISLP